jgi:beta-mannanase
MDQQSPGEDGQQTEKSQQVLNKKHHRNPRLWYRSRTRKVKVSLVGGTLIALLLFCLFATAVSFYGHRGSSRSGSGTPQVQTANPDPTNTLMPMLTPPPAQIFTPVAHATTKPSTSSPHPKGNVTPPNTNSASASVYFGVHMPLTDMSLVSSFEADAQKPVAIVMWYQHWGETDGYQYFQPGWLSAVRAHGSIPLVTWDPWNPSLGANQPTYSLQNIINGNFDAYIVRWAQASRAWGHPYFLRFAPEMNGYWFPWSEQVNGNKAGQFVLAWRHVHDIFTAQGATNVTWVWAPNIIFSNSIPLGELYPGDSYVDWGAMDGYNWGNVGAWHSWTSFTSLFQQTYQAMLAITYKPLMIAETASTEQGGNKATWISDAFTSQLVNNFPHIRAFVWFDIDKETDWRIESSSASQIAFSAAMHSGTYASNWYASLNVSPIPAP